MWKLCSCSRAPPRAADCQPGKTSHFGFPDSSRHDLKFGKILTHLSLKHTYAARLSTTIHDVPRYTGRVESESGRRAKIVLIFQCKLTYFYSTGSTFRITEIYNFIIAKSFPISPSYKLHKFVIRSGNLKVSKMSYMYVIAIAVRTIT